MKKTSKIILTTVLIVLIGIIAGRFIGTKENELKTIRSEKQLLRIYEGDTSGAKELLMGVATMPFSLWLNMWGGAKDSMDGRSCLR